MSDRKINESSHLEDIFPPTPTRFPENIENISLPSGYDFMNVSSIPQSPACSSILHASKAIEATSSSGGADNTLNCTDFLSKELEEALRAEKLLDENLVDEIDEYKCLLKEVASARSKFQASQFVVQSVKEVLENSTELQPDLKDKCSRHLRSSVFLKNVQNFEFLEAVGISRSVSPIVLTSREKRDICSAVEKTMGGILKIESEKEMDFDLMEHLSKNVTMPGSTLAEENARALSLISETDKAIDSCFKTVSSIEDTFDQLWNYRVDKFQKLHEEGMIRLADELKLVELQFRELNLRIKNSIVDQENDEEKLAIALDTLLRKMKIILEENEFSLQKTEAMKDAYDQLKGTKFDEILHEYMEIRETMKQKQWALKELRKPSHNSE